MKLISYLFFGLLAVLPGGAAEDATARVNGPVLGYLEKSDGVRPIIGIPGAAYFAPVLELPSEPTGLELAAVASEAGYAILLTADRESARIFTLRSNQLVGLFANLGSAVKSVLLSEGGTAAALVREGHIDIISGLPNQPKLTRTVETPTSTAFVAVSDDGKTLAIFDGSTISLFDSEGQRQLAGARAVSSLRFRQGSRDLIYIDGNVVMVASSGGVITIAGAADNLSAPRAAIFSPDGRALIADATSQDLLVAQPSSGIFERVKLPCVPADLASINGSTFWFRCETGGQIHLVQLSPNETRVLFVPEPVE
jgi:hypothetical protein